MLGDRCVRNQYYGRDFRGCRRWVRASAKKLRNREVRKQNKKDLRERMSDNLSCEPSNLFFMPADVEDDYDYSFYDFINDDPYKDCKCDMCNSAWAYEAALVLPREK